MEFTDLRDAVAQQFAAMSSQELFITDTDKEELWNLYLDSFPPERNQIFRVRREYDCSCCRSFIKNIGSVVVINDDLSLTSIWDFKVADPGFQQVANALSEYVKSKAISAIYTTPDKRIGVEKTFEDVVWGVPLRWDHFHVQVPARNVKADAALVGKSREAVQVLMRAVREIPVGVVEVVLELIDQGSLYRGDAVRGMLEAVKTLLQQAKASSDLHRHAWKTAGWHSGQAIFYIRNTSIGTLLIDLAEGMELDTAVRRYEAIVAPSNYQRPKALITQSMINLAKQDITELGYVSSLDRKHAVPEDLTAANTLWQGHLKSAALDTALDTLKPNKGLLRMEIVTEVTAEDFLREILPHLTSIEVLMEPRHEANLMSLIKAADPTAPNMFKWPNTFSWSYKGGVADRIKERVKAAGGRVDGDVCCRLSWNNTDDLDLHMAEPNYRIYYANRRAKSPNGGTLDLDANGIDGLRNDPAENIVYPSAGTMQPGEYKLSLKQFCRRDFTNQGFEVELEVFGERYYMCSPNSPAQEEIIPLAVLHKDRSGKITVDLKLEGTSSGREAWGLQFGTFIPVSHILKSPNGWQEPAVGLLHLFFILQGCKTPDTSRGFYNEFLSNDLQRHRKVFEMLAGTLKIPAAERQVSGLGFSLSGNPASLVCRVTGSFTRILKINF